MAEFILHHKIEPEMIQLAERLALKEPLNRSITNGERNTLGTLAELYTLKFLNVIGDDSEIHHSPNFNFDIDARGVKVDVKCKQRTVAPQRDYVASIVAYSKTKQQCDVYAFTQITVDKHDPTSFKDFYLLGFISKEKYFSVSEFKRKGERDGGNRLISGREFKIREDCYNLPYDQLGHCSENDISTLAAHGFKQIYW